MRYRSKPKYVEAFQWFEEMGEIEGVVEFIMDFWSIPFILPNGHKYHNRYGTRIHSGDFVVTYEDDRFPDRGRKEVVSASLFYKEWEEDDGSRN